MIRPHLDLIYRGESSSVGLGVSYIRFPNGDIQSSQLGIVFETGFYSLFTPYDYQGNQFSDDWLALSSDKYTITPRNSLFSVEMKYYLPTSDSLRLDATSYENNIGLVGVKLRKQIENHQFWGVATHGAYAGGVDGYMQIVLDGGYSYDISEKATLSTALVVGAGGGGKVDTGGGLLLGIDLAVDYQLASNLALGISIGYINAPEGQFGAYSYTLSGTVNYDALTINSVSDYLPEHLFRGNVSVNNWRWRLAQQRYDFSDNRQVDLFAAMTEIDVDTYGYLTGQAYGAYDGGAGGYAVGLLGYGLKYPVTGGRFSIIGEIAAGAAGGGGIDVGSGFVVQPMLAVSMKMTDAVGLQVGSGVFAAPKSDLSVKFVQISVNYSFGRVIAETGN
jgi:hypothetical protein